MTTEAFAKIYTDGACKGNPGPGGWGVHAISPDDEIFERNGGERDTTNNRMELTAAIQALDMFPRSVPVRLYIDSQYVRKGITEWIFGWKKRGWKTAEGKPVKNDDLWKILDGLRKDRVVEWEWVRGHNGDPGNERADELANEGVPR